MTDIVERLRLLQSGAQWACGQTAATLEEAAAEIERLRAYSASQGRLLQSGVVIPNEEYAALCAERDRLREALKLAEDVLSRPPWSNNMLADGRHPHGVISAARAALGEDRT